jgi:recombination protein RecR
MTEPASGPVKDRSPETGGRGAGGAKKADGFSSASAVLRGLVEELEKLPGIGRKTAERLAYHLLRVPAEEAMRLAYAIRDVKKSLRSCQRCFHVTEKELCEICEDTGRDATTICVVEQPRDVHAIELSGSYRGLYHVLLGSFAPLEGVEPRDLTIEALLERLRRGNVREVILAMNANFEGDGTSLLLHQKLKAFPGLKVTRLARGLPSGSQIEHMSRTIVADAVEGRREMAE